MIFEWDEAKNRENQRKHGLAFDEAKAIWSGPILTATDDRFDYGEVREFSIGAIQGVIIVTVTHTDRDGVIRIISARRATRSERQRYEHYLQRALG